MKSFTDLFVRRPVLAIVVNVVIIIAGLQAWRSLSVRQYPRSENASVTVATVYVGASADVVRGFVTTAIERSISSADGIEYVESKSLLGLSLVTARLMLNYDPTKALADITAKVNQVRNELPAEAEVPSISVQSADSEFAAVYLSFSSDTLSQSEITDYLVRAVQPRLAALAGVQRGEIYGARTFAMRVWLKPIPTCTPWRSSSNSPFVSRTTRLSGCRTWLKWSLARRITTPRCISTDRPRSLWGCSRCPTPTPSKW
jgi:multidrug efflux pump